MTKKKPRKARNLAPQEEDLQQLQNPKMEEEPSQPSQDQNPEDQNPSDHDIQDLENEPPHEAHPENEEAGKVQLQPQPEQEEEHHRQSEEEEEEVQLQPQQEKEEEEVQLQPQQEKEEEEDHHLGEEEEEVQLQPQQEKEEQQDHHQGEEEEEVQLQLQQEEEEEQDHHQGEDEEEVQEKEEEEVQENEENEEHHQGEEDEQQYHQVEEDEPDGMDLSPTLPPPPSVIVITLPDLTPENRPHIGPNVSRKAPKKKKKKKKKPLKGRKGAAFQKKLEILKENLQPIPFVPCKNLDFSKHEKLLKRLGLWDFAHLEFDRHIRTDLLVQLIANFNPQIRASSVNDLRIGVNRADLGRALKLPAMKKKSNQMEDSDSVLEEFSAESISFINDFVSNWLILHEEDTWMLPGEILKWTQLIKEGHPQKVDWRGLIWFMVEQEMQAAKLSSCYYASHLQCLMKCQREDLFKEEPKVEVYIKEEEEAAHTKISSLDNLQEQKLEMPEIELRLGQEQIECEQVRDEDVMDFEECKEEPGQWRMDGKNELGEHFLQRCDLNEVGGLECRDERKEEEEEERFDLLSKANSLERLSSTDLIQAMGSTSVPFNQPVHLSNQSSGELLASRFDTDMNLGSPSLFGNAGKREISHVDDVRHHTFKENHKRVRNDGHWSHRSSDFDLCMEQVDSWIGKARMMYEAKEQACTNANLHEQVLYSELQQRDNIIEALNRNKIEEQQKRQLENYRLQHELYVMSNLLNSYKKALKETRRAFSEYRKQYPHPEEPLYKDVPGPGGIVLSTMELEKQRLEQEEEDRVKRVMVVEQIKDFELGWSGKLEEHQRKVHLLGSKLSDFEIEVKLLKETFVQRKVSET